MSPKIREIFDKLRKCNNFVPNPKFEIQRKPQQVKDERNV